MTTFKRIAPDHIPQKTRFQETPKYEQGLYDLGQDVYAWLVPNGSWGESNAGLVVGEGASLVVDTLWDLNYTREMLNCMRPLTSQAPIRFLVNTHADGDHFMGNELLKDVQQIITSQASYDEMTHTNPKAPTLLTKVGRVMSLLGKVGPQSLAQAGHWFQAMMTPYDLEQVTPTFPTRKFHGELRLDVGGRAIQLLEVGPMHTHGDTVVYVPDAKVLFAADLLFIGVTPVMWAGPVDNWLRALDKILNMDVRVYVPGHGPLVTEKAPIVSLKNYWEFVAEEVRLRHKAGMPPDQAAREIALSDLFRRRGYVEWNSPERIMVSTYTMYRHLNGDKTPPKIPQLVNILRKQALLAHEFPNAQPTVMRLK